MITSINLKHSHYAELASKNILEINISQSLTMWRSLEELKKEIGYYSKMSYNHVSKVLDLIAYKATDIQMLCDKTSKDMPLLIDFGNDMVLLPLSSMSVNPFFSIVSVLENRNPNFINAISEPRENWLRTNLYAIFEGARYNRVQGNINLRNGNNVITDIDAVIYDYLTGELAIFQLKWQDYYLSDVRKLRSRAKNLVKDLDSWSEKTVSWIEKNGINSFLRNARMIITDVNVSGVYLFGISQNSSRAHGYGYALK